MSGYKSFGAQEREYACDYLRFHIFPEPVELTPAERVRINEIGQIASAVLKKANRLVIAAMTSGDPEDEWLVKIMLGSIPAEHRQFAKELAVAVGDRYPVRLFRADVLGNGQIAELQCPGSGWAYNLALEEYYGVKPADSNVVRTYRHWAKGRSVSWWLHDSMHKSSVLHAQDVCRTAGIDLTVYTEETFNPDAVEAVIKRPPLPELISSEKGRRLLQRWLAGEVEVDLQPSMAPETKHLMALMRHPKTRHHFIDEERALCPATYFIDSPDTSVHFSYGCSRTIREVFEHHRRGVVKYGGAVKALRGGCHAVFNIGVKSMKLPERQDLMRKALDSYVCGEAWVLQEFIYAPRKVPGIYRPQFILFRPHYYIADDGQVELVANVINTRADWKVHARTDAHLGLCF